MAKIKYSALVSDMRNKLNGSVMSKNRYGSYVRNKVTPVNPQTSFQQAARQSLGNLSSSYRELTAAQIKQWNLSGQNFPFTDIFGDIKYLSGQTLFVKLNANLEKVGSPRISNPPLPVGFPEMSIVSSTVTVSAGTLSSAKITMDLESTPVGYKAVVYATPGLSRARSFVKNQYRLLGSFDISENDIDLATEYPNRFGVPLADEVVHFRVALVSVATGQQGIPLASEAVVR